MDYTIDDYREYAASELVPFFMDVADGDEAEAFAAALKRLRAYQSDTPRDVQLAAEESVYILTAVVCGKAGFLMGPPGNTLWDAAMALNEKAIKVLKVMVARKKTVMPGFWDDVSFRQAVAFALTRLRLVDAIGVEPALVAPKVNPPTPKVKIVAAEPMTLALLARLDGPFAKPSRQQRTQSRD